MTVSVPLVPIGTAGPPVRVTSVDQVALEARAAALATRSIKTSSKRAALHLAIRCMDLTTLEGADTPEKVASLCQKARRPEPADPAVPPVAAVCVYPEMVDAALAGVAGSPVRVASVAGAFPSGLSALDSRTADIADAACGGAHLKVILEAGELGSYDRIRRASMLAMAAGADFVKTSTGKIPRASSLPIVLCMAEAVRDYADQVGTTVGIKAAGGIRTAKQAWQYLVVVGETLGEAWLTPDRFRIGASGLLNDVLLQLRRLDTGHYAGPDYVTVD